MAMNASFASSFVSNSGMGMFQSAHTGFPEYDEVGLQD